MKKSLAVLANGAVNYSKKTFSLALLFVMVAARKSVSEYMQPQTVSVACAVRTRMMSERLQVSVVDVAWKLNAGLLENTHVNTRTLDERHAHQRRPLKTGRGETLETNKRKRKTLDFCLKRIYIQTLVASSRGYRTERVAGKVTAQCKPSGVTRTF